MSSSPRVESAEQSLRTRASAIYPASLAQRRLWFLNELRAPTAAYNVNIGLWLYGRLNLEALQAGIQQIVNRHETLRTTFALRGGELLQLVEPRCEVVLTLTDFSAPEQPYPSAYEFAKQEVAEPFDLSKGPLFRVKLLRIRTEEHVLLCTMHHIITDAWSMQLFTKELAAFYAATTGRTDAALPELSIQYGDYAYWQRDLLGTDFARDQVAYWKRTLQGVPRLLQLPTDRPRPAEQNLEGLSQTFAVPGEIITGATSLAAQQRVTTFMLLLAAFKVLLYRYSGKPEVCVGVPVAGRTRLESESLIGFFVDTLVFRDDLSGNPRFIELLAAVRETTLGALANADVPFEKVVEVLHPDRSLSYNPIFQVMFSVIPSAIRSHAFGNVVAYPYVVDASHAMLDLSATFIEDSDGKWWLEINFDTGLFEIERIHRIFEDYMGLLRHLIARPEMRIDNVTLRNGTTEAKASDVMNGGDEAPSAPAAFSQVSERSHWSERELLTSIWRNVLGIEQVGVHDNFFDIGGHSLLAADLVAQIRQATGRKLPVSAIFRAPTIEGLAALLHDDTASQPDPVLMQLSRGDDTIPFFAVAEPGVDSLGFALLARTLGPRHSVHKLQGTGAAVWERPLERREIQALADQYVSAMRTVQRRGPFCLGGMCNGVLIAQEMIQQLESQGETVALFAILDTWVLEHSQVKMLWAINYYKDRMQMFRRLPAREQLALSRRVLKRLLAPRHKRRSKWSEAYWPDDGFRAPRFAAPVLLFKRPRQPFFYVRDPEMGWGQRSTGGVEVCEVNCGHFELLRQPHVSVVAQTLSARLQEINRMAGDGTLSFAAGRRPMQSALPSLATERAR
ncbi:MAG TPA: condensation domain-containing protein [Candidatus Sulfotelmatobacter sp.]|nr:condensation domain-containing protein [Candidatus Sulfotelmatobacter sp.]HLM82257.1 condensation domain-containing protein [Terriglobales bacterium]